MTDRYRIEITYKDGTSASVHTVTAPEDAAKSAHVTVPGTDKVRLKHERGGEFWLDISEVRSAKWHALGAAAPAGDQGE